MKNKGLANPRYSKRQARGPKLSMKNYCNYFQNLNLKSELWNHLLSAIINITSANLCLKISHILIWRLIPTMTNISATKASKHSGKNLKKVIICKICAIMGVSQPTCNFQINIKESMISRRLYSCRKVCLRDA